jgi:Flp pilus assembly protein TadG
MLTLRRLLGRSRRGLYRGESGQSLAEFAIAVPMLLLLFVGMVEFARGWMVRQVIVNVAREGARLAVLPSSTQATVAARVDSLLTVSGINPASASVSINTCDGTACAGQPDIVQISVPYQFALIGPVLNYVCSSCSLGTVNLTSTSEMRSE